MGALPIAVHGIAIFILHCLVTLRSYCDSSSYMVVDRVIPISVLIKFYIGLMDIKDEKIIEPKTDLYSANADLYALRAMVNA